MLTPQWLWTSRGASARAARMILIPPSLLYRAGMGLRSKAYGLRLLSSRAAPVPVVSVGNLTVGGSGKTPLASWVAAYYVRNGTVPGIVMRGYGGDEAQVHRRLVEEAIVVENPDRIAGAVRAARNGAGVIILDDAFQRLDIQRDLNIVVVSAESSRAVGWTLPAGPWREGVGALRRADFVVVTRKRAGRAVSEDVAERLGRQSGGCPVAIARLGINGLRWLISGGDVAPEALDGSRVLAVAGIADPESFAGQCRQLGAEVTLMPLPDHHAYTRRDVDRMLHAGRRVDYVVMTEKDAAKLEPVWPDAEPEPLVASLDVGWESGLEAFETALDTVVTGVENF